MPNQGIPVTDSDHQMRDKVVVLLTSTVTPRAYREQTAVHDPRQRLKQYISAIEFWLNYADERIAGVVFCDNSGIERIRFGDISSSFGRELEFISFVDDYKPDNVHYGFSELGIIDFAVKNSQLIQKSDGVLKATGRFSFPKASRLLDEIESNCSFSIDCYKIKSKNIQFPFRCRTQMFYFKRPFYIRYFLDTRHEMVGMCSHIEEFIARKLEGIDTTNANITYRWKRECNPTGIGSNGHRYRSAANRIKYSIRGFLRTFFPCLWL
jgi:hypothetical protein